MQLQLLTEREIVPYQVRPTESTKLPNSNIYGHQLTIVNDLRKDEFKQFWKQVSLSKKQTIMIVTEKELNMQIKESVYWFSLRYALENYSKLLTDRRTIEIFRNEVGFFLPPERISEDTMCEMIEYAAFYDKCVMPASPSKPSQLFSEFESEAFNLFHKEPEDLGIHYCILRFKMFLCWLFCNHMDKAFQMHKREEEADRAAALLLKEPADKEKKKTKKKKRGKKTATASATASATTSATTTTTTSTTTTTTDEQIKEQKSATSGRKPTKEEKINGTELLSSSKAPPSQQSLSSQKSLDPELAALPIPPPSPSLEAQRISRLLLGDGSEGATNDRRRGKPEASKLPFVSLRQLFLRKDPLEDILQNSVTKRNPGITKTV